MTSAIQHEASEALEHVTGGKLDQLSHAQLAWFAQLTRGMADLAEEEMKRRGVHYLPVFRRNLNA